MKRRDAVDRLIGMREAFDHGPQADQAFLEAMQANFRRHVDHCADFGRYCRMVGVMPDDIHDHEDVFRIPHVFVANFKRRTFITGSRDDIHLTLTSSGTGGEKSAIHLDRPSLARITSIVHHIYDAFGMVDRTTPTNYLAFTYDPRVARDLGTAFSDKLLTGLTRVGRVHYAIRWDAARSEFRLDREKCWQALERFAREDRPIRLLGFPAMIHDVLGQYARATGKRFQFGERSYLITGGGWKNLADQEIPKSEFRRLVSEWLGIPEANIRDLYGMVEHGVPYCECEHFHMHVPIYSRVVVRSPITLERLPLGEVGLFHMLTPYLNSFPALSLLTSDVGRLYADCPCGRPSPWLELMGRGGVTRHKGCAIAALDVLKAG